MHHRYSRSFGPTFVRSKSSPPLSFTALCLRIVRGAAVALAAEAIVIRCQRQTAHKFRVPRRTSSVEQLSLLCRTAAVVPRAQTGRMKRMCAMLENHRAVGFSSPPGRFVGVLHCEPAPCARRLDGYARRAASTAIPQGFLQSRCHHFLQARPRRHLFCRTRNVRYWHSRMAARVFFSARSSRACVEERICSCAIESNLTALARHS